MVNKYRNIVILTGAGISAESGIATFRDSGGLWEKHRIEDVATPEGYKRNPKLVLDFYNARRKASIEAKPNNAHIALAKLEEELSKKNEGSVLIITQNVDNLHEKGGSKNIIHMHGELNKIRCTKCGNIFEEFCDVTLDSTCEKCESIGKLRPHIVWFGETPFDMYEIEKSLINCDLFISIGTSGSVYPAANFIDIVNNQNKKAHTVEINLEKSTGSEKFGEQISGKAGTEVPKFVKKLLEF